MFFKKTPRGTHTDVSTPRSAAVGDFLADGSFVCALGSLTVEEVALARVNFKKFDADGDGVISRADFGAANALVVRPAVILGGAGPPGPPGIPPVAVDAVAKMAAAGALGKKSGVVDGADAIVAAVAALK